MTNLLFITIDDLFSLSAWPLYDGIAQTPNMDALAARGVNFDAAYADVALCNPSRAAILTGQTPWQTGVITNNQDLSHNVDIGASTLPGILKTAGFEVTLGGKVFHSVPADQTHKVTDNLLAPEGMRNTTSPVYDNVNNLYYGAAQEPLLDSDLVVRASEYMATLDGSVPQALFLGIYRPHADWVVPQEFIDLYDGIDIPIPDFVDDAERAEFAQAFKTTIFHEDMLALGVWEDLVRHYLASVSYADAMLGGLLDALESSAIADDTVVMVMSDHGYHLGDAGNWHKFTTHEQSARAPLLMALPDGTTAEITAPVNLSSVAATALELLDLPPEPQMRPSLVPLITEGSTGAEQAVTWMNGSFSLRTETHRYIRYETGEEDLFDLRTDIYAQDDIAESDPDQLALMRRAAESVLDGIFINPTEAVTGGATDTTYYMLEGQVPITDPSGIDQVITNRDYTLPDGIEHLGVVRPSQSVLFFGNALDNRISSASFDDTIRGQAGDDSIFSSLGDDILHGGAGDDSILSSSGNDTVRGGAGDDTLIAGHGSDLFSGHSGADLLLGEAGNDTLDGGPGNDTMDGSVGSDLMIGGPGDDLLDDDAGLDTIRGGRGDDTLRLGTGRDTFDGGPGHDVVEIDLRVESLEQGRHVIDLATGASIPVEAPRQNDLFIDVEGVRVFGPYDISVTGSAADNTIETDRGHDDVHGGRGADTVGGGGGDDTLAGGPGDDLLVGQNGADLLRGGPGDDRLFGDAEDDRIFGQAGADRLGGGAGRDLLNGGGGADTLVAGEGDDRVIGGGQGDLLLGEDGADMIAGRSGDDTLEGGLGADMLRAGGGEDVLHGGNGDDRLKGGAGADVFHFNAMHATGADRIVDFDPEEDGLRLIGVQFEDLTIRGVTSARILWETGEVTINGLAPGDVHPDLFDFL